MRIRVPARRTRAVARAVRLQALLLAAAAVALRLVLITGPPRPDEVGYLLVAAHARPHGPFLYGDLWVDRPPLLVAIFASANALASLMDTDPVLTARLLATAGVGLLVLVSCAAGARLGGRHGSLLAGVVAGVLTRTTTWGRAGALLAATAAGVALVVGAALVWTAAWGTGPAGVHDALVGFRSGSLEVIATQRLANPARRAWLLAAVAVLSGLAPLVVLLLTRVLREGARRRIDPVGIGLAAMLVWGRSRWPLWARHGWRAPPDRAPRTRVSGAQVGARSWPCRSWWPWSPSPRWSRPA